MARWSPEWERAADKIWPGIRDDSAASSDCAANKEGKKDERNVKREVYVEKLTEQIPDGDSRTIELWNIGDLQIEWKYKRRDQNRWHPPLQLKPSAWLGHMRYCLEAYVNRTWATEGIFEIIIPPLLKRELMLFCWNHKNTNFCYLEMEI